MQNRTNVFIVCLLLCLPTAILAQDNWPSHRGPNGNYHLQTETEYPLKWSVAADENIRWRKPLPETGHSGIAAWNDRLFLTCFRKLTEADNAKDHKGRLATLASETCGHCLSAETGDILWSCDLPGQRPNQVNGTFTDSTTPTPITDGKHVWFVNAGGWMACYTVEGKMVWQRAFDVRTKHSAKLFQPFLHDGKLYYAMMRDKNDPQRREQTAKDWDKNSKTGWPWLYVRCFDALTGEPAGVLPDGISCHSKGSLGIVAGEPVLLYARGGPHFPPEKPFGLAVSKLDNHETVWFKPNGNLEGTDFVNEKHTFSFTRKAVNLIGLQNGETVKSIPIPKTAKATLFDQVSGKYESSEISTDKWKRLVTHHGNVGVGKFHFFMADKAGLLGRINIESGEFHFLQVPLQIAFDRDEKKLLWDNFTGGDNTGSGFEIQGDKRRLSHGFGHVTAATPIVINDRIYICSMLGTVWVIDAKAERFDATALLAVNDFGLPGQTWTLSPITAANGYLYQRTSREIICIGE